TIGQRRSSMLDGDMIRSATSTPRELLVRAAVPPRQDALAFSAWEFSSNRSKCQIANRSTRPVEQLSHDRFELPQHFARRRRIVPVLVIVDHQPQPFAGNHAKVEGCAGV